MGSQPLDSALGVGEIKVRGYTVRKLPLGAYFALLRKLDNVPRELLGELASAWDDAGKGGGNAAVLEVVLKVAARFPDEVLSLVAQAIGVEKEELEKDRELGIDGLVELAEAVWQVNRIGEMLANAKKKLPPQVQEYLASLMKAGKTGSTK